MSSGGTGVTSMNPVAKELWEEGLAVESFRLVSEGQFEEEAVKQLFMDVAKRPGCSATRRIDHNITDLQGQLILLRSHTTQLIIQLLFRRMSEVSL